MEGYHASSAYSQASPISELYEIATITRRHADERVIAPHAPAIAIQLDTKRRGHTVDQNLRAVVPSRRRAIVLPAIQLLRDPGAMGLEEGERIALDAAARQRHAYCAVGEHAQDVTASAAMPDEHDRAWLAGHWPGERQAELHGELR